MKLCIHLLWFYFSSFFFAQKCYWQNVIDILKCSFLKLSQSKCQNEKNDEKYPTEGERDADE